jgi:hypothetical protein
MEGWDSFFLGHVGASAALGGLLFVAISLNLPQISSAPGLADRALIALSLLLAILVVSSFMLIPGQPPAVLGVEVLLVGIGLAVLGTTRRQRSDNRAKTIGNAVFLAVAVLPYVVGGAAILAGGLRAGLYLVAAAIVLSLVKAVLDAWVLLIEINR